jgi:hypothetical protein
MFSLTRCTVIHLYNQVTPDVGRFHNKFRKTNVTEAIRDIEVRFLHLNSYTYITTHSRPMYMILYLVDKHQIKT